MRQTKKAILYLLLSLITLASTLFAWMSIARVANIGNLGGGITDYSSLVSFYIRRIGEEDFTEINDYIAVEHAFGDTAPGETYEFKIVLNNFTTEHRRIVPEFSNIFTNFMPGYEDYDLRDVFYIQDGQVYIEEYSDFSVDEEETIADDTDIYNIPQLDTSVVIKHGQLLSPFRLNNLITFTSETENTLYLSYAFLAKVGYKTVMRFTLVYDPTTEDIAYQDNQLYFYGLFLRGV